MRKDAYNKLVTLAHFFLAVISGDEKAGLNEDAIHVNFVEVQSGNHINQQSV